MTDISAVSIPPLSVSLSLSLSLSLSFSLSLSLSFSFYNQEKMKFKNPDLADVIHPWIWKLSSRNVYSIVGVN